MITEFPNQYIKLSMNKQRIFQNEKELSISSNDHESHFGLVKYKNNCYFIIKMREHLIFKAFIHVLYPNIKGTHMLYMRLPK